MITTCRKHVPLGWILIACIPMVATRYGDSAAGSSFVFTLKKFIENPALITLILSIPMVLSFIVSPLAAFISDRVWTRFGRRMPFLVTAWIGMAVCFVLMPIMPNIWLVSAIYVIFDLFRSLTSTFEPLRNEIIPPQQRVRGAMVMEWVGSITQTLFWFVVFGRFDDVVFVAGFPMTGEAAMYWSAALIMVVIAMAMAIGVREKEPIGDSRGERLSPASIIKGLADRDLWPVYTLVFSAALLSAGLGPLGVLVYTDTFGFTKQDQGTNVVVGGLINMCIIGFLGWWAQRMERIRAYQVLIILALVINMGYYCYIEFVLPDQRATVVEAIVFGETLSIIGLLKNMLYYPLAYDYVIRNKMGTFQAGGVMITKLTSIITVNMVGVFVTFYSFLFMPPAGEMARVVLREAVPAAAVHAAVAGTVWREPVAEGKAISAADIDVRPFRASGFIEENGRAWELRYDDGHAKRLAKERDDLAAELRLLEIGNEPGKASRREEVKARLASLKAELSARAADFRAQVAGAFSGQLMEEGDGIRAAQVLPARILAFPVLGHLSSARQELILDELRRRDAAVVDLRMESVEGSGRRLLLGVVDGRGDDARLGAELAEIANRLVPGLISAAPAETVRTTGLRIEVATVEEPLEDRPSPITAVVNVIRSWFGGDVLPDKRIRAMGRNLRSIDSTPQVSAQRGSGEQRGVVITALLRPGGAPPIRTSGTPDAIDARLAALLGGPAEVAAARALYERIIPAAAAMRLTVVRPVVGNDYVPVKYDYMSGYLMMFALGLIGLWLTILFCRRERQGLIRKLGIEEEKELT